MAVLTYKSIKLNNPIRKLNEPLEFELEMYSRQDISDGVIFTVMYTIDVTKDNKDLILSETEICPIPKGKIKFTLEADAPDVNKIPYNCLFGLTSIIISGTYKDQEFIRIGYIVDIYYPGISNEKLINYDEEEEVIDEEDESEEIIDENDEDLKDFIVNDEEDEGNHTIEEDDEEDNKDDDEDDNEKGSVEGNEKDNAEDIKEDSVKGNEKDIKENDEEDSVEDNEEDTEEDDEEDNKDDDEDDSVEDTEEDIKENDEDDNEKGSVEGNEDDSVEDNEDDNADIKKDDSVEDDNNDNINNINDNTVIKEIPKKFMDAVMDNLKKEDIYKPCEELVVEDEKGDTFEYRGYIIEKSKIEMNIMIPPSVHEVEIDWNDKQKELEENVKRARINK